MKHTAFTVLFCIFLKNLSTESNTLELLYQYDIPIKPLVIVYLFIVKQAIKHLLLTFVLTFPTLYHCFPICDKI